MATVIDPVCGMQLDDQQTAINSQYMNRTYYFCSLGCKQQFGNDPQRLAELADPVEEVLNKVQGVVDVVGVQKGNPEVTWTIDPVTSERYGLTVTQVSDQLAGNWLGEVATDLRLADRRVPVRVRLPDAYRFDPTETLLHDHGVLITDPSERPWMRWW